MIDKKSVDSQNAIRVNSNAYTTEDGTAKMSEMHGPSSEMQQYISNLPSQPPTDRDNRQEDSNVTVRAPTSHLASSAKRVNTGNI